MSSSKSLGAYIARFTASKPAIGEVYFTKRRNMKSTLLVSMLLGCGILSAGSFMKISPESPVNIVLPETASVAEKNAAEEIQSYLLKMTGTDCKIVKEKDAGKSASIHVGPTSLAKESILDYDKLEREEWVIRDYKGNLILAGGRPRGTIYAAFEFLERLGVTWPDEVTEYVPKVPSLVLESINVRSKPVIMNRCIYSGHHATTGIVAKYYARNKMNAQITPAAKCGGVEQHGSPGGCHTFHGYTKPEWPDEWFALDAKGKRVRSNSGSGPGQLCLTNSDLRKAMAARLREFIALDRKGRAPEDWPRIYDISHNDCNGQCMCPACKAMADAEGGYSGPMLDFINAIANDIAKDFPEIYVQTFAYTWTLDAPKTIKPASNVMVRICKLGCEFGPSGKADTLFPNVHPRNKDYYDNFMKWAAIAPNIAVWDYWIIYTKAYNPPYLNALNFQQDIKFYRDNQVKTMFVECESPINTSFAHFKYWYGLKMMQDPEQSYDKLADRFCLAYYGAAAKPMRQYMDYLQKRENDADVALGLASLGMKVSKILSKPRKGDDVLPYTDLEFFTKVNGWLDEAEKLASSSPECLAHVRKERLPVDITLLNSLDKYAAEPPVGNLIPKTKEALFERYAAVCTAQAQYFYGDGPYRKNAGKLKEALDKIEVIKACVLTSDTFLPEQFKGKDAIIFSWPMLASRSKAVFDGDAYGGRALVLPERTSANYHRLPFTMGTYNRSKAKFMLNYSIPAEKIPQDGKYHWYDLGRCKIEPSAYVWIHWTWLLQFFVDGAYTEGEDNMWNVHVSLKLDGPPYVQDSKNKPAVMVDRIILIK